MVPLICLKQNRIKNKTRKNGLGTIEYKTRASYRVIRRSKRNQRKLAFLISATTLSFYITWTPYAVGSILAMASTMTNRKIRAVSILFAKSGIVLNPILYIFFNKDVSF